MRYSYVTGPALPKKVINETIAALTYINDPKHFSACSKIVDQQLLGSQQNNALDEVIPGKSFEDITEKVKYWTSSDTMEVAKMYTWVKGMGYTAQDITDKLNLSHRAVDRFFSALDGSMPTSFKGDWSNPLAGMTASDIEDLNKYYDFETALGPAIKELMEYQRQLKQLEGFERFAEFLSARYKQKRSPQDQKRKDGGDVLPPDAAAMEIMWHTTTAYHNILDGGFKTREQLGDSAGLGGYVKGISFTASLEIAEAIKDALQDAVKLLNGPLTKERLTKFGQDLGVSSKNIEESLKQTGLLQHEASLEDAFDYYKYLLAFAQNEGVRFDPLFIGVKAENIQKLNPKNIGIIEAVINTDLAHSYHSSMEEWRVPLNGIVRYGKVGSQKL